MAGVKALLGRWRRNRTRPAALGRHESFLVYRQGYYFKLALLVCGVSTLAYVIHDPVEGRSGSTWLGYSLGVLSAALIIWLAWLGVRKRQFREGRAPVQAWVSGHVYLGLSLILLATLHAGFQVGWNVHTLAYVLMLMVIVSGIYGVAAYSSLPEKITAARNQMEFRAMLDEVRELNESVLSLADKIDPETHAIVVRSVANARIGGSAWEQLRGRYPRRGDTGALDKFFKLKKAQLEMQATPAAVPGAGSRRQGTIMFMADQIFAGRGEKGSESLQKLLQALAKRDVLIERINRDITLRARLSVWLYLHVPLTIGLLVALFAHVLSVYLYW